MQTGTAIADNDRAAHFGPYRVLREVGHGGAARVYEAEHVQLGKRVAIKAIGPQRRTSTSSIAHASARLLREGRAAVRLTHPNVVEVFDIAEQDGLPYLVMEFVDGGTLAEFLAERAPLTTADLVELFMPLMAAVTHAHGLGIVHRDLKPENCLLSYDLDGHMTPKLADFGVCKALGGTATFLTHDDGLLGTLRYMAPEQLRSARSAGPAADQYSLAVMIYVAATGCSPMIESDPVSLMRRAAAGEPLLSDTFASSLSPSLRTLLTRALATAEAERFPSIREFGSALLALGDLRTRARWLHWANAGQASPDSARNRLLQGETWNDDNHSVVDSIRAFDGNRAPAAKSGAHRPLKLLVAAPIIVASFLVGAKASQTPNAMPAPRAHTASLANTANEEPEAALRARVSTPASEPPISPPAPRNVAPMHDPTAARATRAVQIRKAEPTGVTQRPNNKSPARSVNEPQMGPNGAPILD